MGTTPIIFKYPLDLTGNNPNNLVVAETHTLPVGTNRAIVPNYGAFYAQSLVVRDVATGQLLAPHTQFLAVQLYVEATQKTGLEVTAAVVVIDPNVSGQIEIDYQAIGGEFSYNVQSVRQMLEDLDLDARPVVWGDIIGAPNRFPPAPHLHDAGDVYGFEYLVEQLEAVRYAILQGSDVSFNELRQMMIALEAQLQATIYPLSTDQEAIDGVKEDVLVTPKALKAALDNALFLKHNNDDNPHQTNATHVGLGDVQNVGFITTGDVVANISAPVYP